MNDQTSSDLSLPARLAAAFAAAIARVAPGGATPEGLIRPSRDPRFGDFQCNAPMSLAAALGRKPRDVAGEIVAAVGDSLAGTIEPLEIAGPGFINIRLRAAAIAAEVERIPAAAPGVDRCGVAADPVALRVVIDYSSPNIAKQMHVGHLRSTIIGDALARVLQFAGHTVIRQNHIGDWGTQFGRVVLALWHMAMAERHEPQRLSRVLDALQAAAGDLEKRRSVVREVLETHRRDFASDPDDGAFQKFLDRAGREVSLAELELGYRFVNALEEAAEGLGETIQTRDGVTIPYESLSRHVTMMIQRQDAVRDRTETAAWRLWTEKSLDYLDTMYARLGVLLTRDDVYGESRFHDQLKGTIDALRSALPPGRSRDGASWAECRDDAGAVCVFFWNADGSPTYRNPDGDPLPLIVQKSDGAYLYATTDLAAVRHRLGNAPGQLDARRAIYVVGAPARLHLEMVFACARLAGWTAGASLEHVAFGQVLGEDRKLLRTRAGGTVKLVELLDEAEKRAMDLVASKNATAEEGEQLPEEELRWIARAAGIGAVKWFDLARDRNSDYVFNWDNMLAMQGSTAPYMMYAYARIRSICRKVQSELRVGPAEFERAALSVAEPAERALALRLLAFGDAVAVVVRDLTPHVLCNYLYELSGEFNRFYEACPILKASDAGLRLSRLRLADLTARVLRRGLGLLGIDALERM